MQIPTTTTFQLGSGPTLNVVDGNGVGWFVNQDGFTGGGEPTTTLDPQQNVRARGTWSGDSFPVGRTLTLAGRIIAPTPALLNAAIDSLINAVSASGFTLTVTESGVSWTSLVKRSGETLTPKITNLIAAFSIQVHADDSRKFGTPQVGSTNLPVSVGNFTIPFTVPFALNSTLVSGTVTLTNPGNEVGKVFLRVDGPCTGPQITHVGTGGAVTFASSLVLGVGEFLTIDMDNQQVLAQGQANRAMYTTSAGFSGFDPGLNVWSFAAGVYNAASLLTVFATGARK